MLAPRMLSVAAETDPGGHLSLRVIMHRRIAVGVKVQRAGSVIPLQGPRVPC